MHRDPQYLQNAPVQASGFHERMKIGREIGESVFLCGQVAQHVSDDWIIFERVDVKCGSVWQSIWRRLKNEIKLSWWVDDGNTV